MSFLESALDLAGRGFHVFPLIPNSKLPLIDDFPNRASRDRKQIKDWWLDPVLELEQPYNIGISTSRFGDAEALIVVDVDNKGEKHGDKEVLKLIQEGKPFPPTYTQTTPTGGRHLFYKANEAVKQGESVLAHGVDIRSRGGYVVGPGSRINDKYYKNKETQVQPAPTWIIQACGQVPEKKENANEKLEGVDNAKSKERAIFYLENEAPLSIKGDGGDHTCYAVAAKVKDFGVDADACLELMLDHWNDRCPPGWSPEKLSIKIANVYQYGREPIGISAPETQFTPTQTPEEKSYLEKLNDDHALVYMGGNHFIIHETKDEKGRDTFELLNEATFKRMHSPYSVQQGEGRPKTQAEIWLNWEGRREYNGLCFAPERKPRNGYYNLWRGFTCEPLAYKDATPKAKKGFDMFIEHARENVCLGNEALLTWLLGYFAHMIQKPFERPLTTLVFRGSKGVGKNALVDRIGNLLGNSHYLVAHDGRYLTSNFNGHLDSCLCLVLDEAFWSGDKAAEGKLKGLTTAPEILIERKGKEPYTVDNLVRLIVIGNEDWIVPASNDERRYAVYEVGEGKKQVGKYFEDMRLNLDLHGGNRVLLHFLKAFELTNVDVNTAPSTAALLEQKQSSLSLIQQWWYDCLADGRIASSAVSDWPEEIDKDNLRSSYRKYINERQVTSRIPDQRVFGKSLKSMMPTIVTNQKRREGDRTISVYRMPTLAVARKAWSKFIGHTVTWDGDDNAT